MSGPADERSAWAHTSLAAALIAVDPELGGVCLRAGAGPVRDAWLSVFRQCLPMDAPLLRVPLNIGDEGLLGGLDLAATLRTGRAVLQDGLLVRADGGNLCLAMAERWSAASLSRLTGALDDGTIRIERDGFALDRATRFAVVALDESDGEDARPQPSLLDRLAFHLDLSALSIRDVEACDISADDVAAARSSLILVQDDEAQAERMVALAARFGISSVRAVLMTLRAARAACALRGDDVVSEDDLALAARLVLAPRATQAPQEQPQAQESDESDADQPEETPQESQGPDPEDAASGEAQDRIDEAVRAALPADLLAHLAAQSARTSSGNRGGKTGDIKTSRRRGRPVGVRAGHPRDGRLALVETLRAAAPWQKVRRNTHVHQGDGRVLIRAEDFRIRRLSDRQESVAIFVIDASGSSALQRLAEIKGAIELLLADCYVRRDHVALIAFRGRNAELLVPPTRSLTRARRLLSGLPGGGGTPIASGLEAALALAESVRRHGQSPLIVLMTDGRANIGRDGQPGRAKAFDDAISVSRQIHAGGFAALAIDTAPALQRAADAPTAKLGQAMNARYVKLPYADAAQVSRAVRAAAPNS